MIATLEDIIESLADEMGVYGSHVDGEQIVCRCCWTSDLKSRLMAVTMGCNHTFKFLRQETNAADSRYRADKIVSDVYFCERCLEYKRVEVDRLVPEDAGSGYVSTKHPSWRGAW